MFENSIMCPMVSVTAILPGSKWSVLFLRIEMLGCDGQDFSFFSGRILGLC